MYKKINNLLIILSVLFLTSNFAYARGGSGGGGGGHSSYSSSSGSSSRSVSTTTSKSSYSTPSTKSTISPDTASPKTASQTMMAKVDTAQKSAAAYNSYKAEQSKFTMKSTPYQGWSSYKSSLINRSIYQSTPRTTPVIYTQQRNNFYTTNHYIMPSYGYNSYQRFGVFDSLALWYMMDHIHDSQYRSMYYNQQNNIDMVQWRKEANRLAQTNADLKSKLDEMDKEVDQLKGTPRDEKYIPSEMGSVALTPIDEFSWLKLFFWSSLFIPIIIILLFLLKRRKELNAYRLRTNNW